MRWKNANVARAARILVSCAALLGAGCRTGGKVRSDLKSVPPGVEGATIQPLGREDSAGNALLEVEFERGDARLAKGVPIFPHGKETVLRDNGRDGDSKAGDGVFSALVHVDFGGLATQAEAAAQARPAPARPVFRGREIVGTEDAAEERIKRLTPLRDMAKLIRDKAKISLFDMTSGVDPAGIDPARSLMVTDPTVVTDPGRTVDPCTGAGNPNGAWTFKHLVTEMTAGTGVDPADFVERWLRLWTAPQPVSSGFVAASRTTTRGFISR